MPHVLLAENDPAVAGAVIRALVTSGYGVRAVETAADALRDVTTRPPDMVILDLGLPDIDGADALVMLRAVCDAPVIVSTERRSESDAVRLLDTTADDYVVKPFSTGQLVAKVNAVFRRTRRAAPVLADEPILVGGLRLDPARRTAALDGRPLALTRKEYDLLSYLAGRADRVVTRSELSTNVWQRPYLGTDRTVDVHLSWLRRKLGESGETPRYLRTIRGVGFMLVNPHAAPQPGGRPDTAR
ncbi:response regulator transcription factor [Goodfellowiella coeruleoviolacea]|uniref:DNA-binding response regulator, OmpR family, contains REC and winged-helix (WHTH) domain n=1 Tax=Goodfellowiella coeruleoviolacea TaxID=334858 RepID=A0AAE3GL07_9PSEU|nr:response regulator transcription factor [Goodfellowiella coeruleoviolacea]MCP2170141.1 DNA-binding response regulator, OmpR family, contains REC and winged-helix (wHTH) domain [Goodfellowiella coeruleoviolacea]